MLDAEEHLHLAIRASQDGDIKLSLEELHLCLEKDKTNATALFLMGAKHAELGLFDRAKEEMEKAISLDPSIEIAHLQLGLLYAQGGDNDKALSYWNHLIEHATESYYKCFSIGLIDLTKGHTESAMEKLQEGMKDNTVNPALNDMIENIIKSLDNTSAEDTDSESPQESSVYMGAYQNNKLEN